MDTLRQLSVLLSISAEAEGVYSVGGSEELGISWVSLHVLPSGVGPSARHQLKVFLGNTHLVLERLRTIGCSARTEGATPGLIPATIIKHVIPLVVILLSFVLHCCLQIFEKYTLQI